MLKWKMRWSALVTRDDIYHTAYTHIQIHYAEWRSAQNTGIGWREREREWEKKCRKSKNHLAYIWNTTNNNTPRVKWSEIWWYIKKDHKK